ncbi:MAG: DUF3015 domain-containing protein [Hahellaceae bacterium]|nr:DUF3015 domain-containing protein [Hahellaceae bacterium]MCP5168769.1 DUF3015 domain-containing protein [Hahellaceae bacterium]
MKKLLVAAGLMTASLTAFAEAPGGPGCGWGNMLLNGQKGLPMHLLATITNGTSGNNTFGMTSGTNGCSVGGTLTYGGKSMIDLSSIMDEFSEDVARGHGDAMTTIAVALDVQAEDRVVFNEVMHENFTAIFTAEDMTAEDVMVNVLAVMKSDSRLAKYAA